MTYIATFHTHFGAMEFENMLKKQDIVGQMMPVPRALSASCGVCVKFSYDGILEYSQNTNLDCVYRVEDKKYILLHQNE